MTTKLRATQRRGDAAAFTLVEMLVALGVLAIALSVVGVVFSVTTRTINQAAALSELQASVRQFALQLREDLAFVDPGESVLILVGRTQKAALTDADLAAGRYYRVLTGDPNDVPAGYNPQISPNLDSPNQNGYSDYSDPRADILACITKRPAASRAPAPRPPANDPYAAGARFSPSLVVYGHAAIGRAERTLAGQDLTFQWSDVVRHIDEFKLPKPRGLDFSALPASQWHLARRSTILIDPSQSGSANYVNRIAAADFGRILRGEPTADRPGDVVTLSWQRVLGEFSQDASVLASPYPKSQGMVAPAMPAGALTLAENLLYKDSAGKSNHHVATVLPDPPTELASNLALHMLPGCAWFQVEFLMPEDPRNSLDYVANDSNDAQRTDMPRWTEVRDGETYLFVPDTTYNRSLIAQQIDPVTGSPTGRLRDFALINPTLPGPPPSAGPDTVDNRRIRLWPWAIRVTVRVFDPRGRLDGPLERTIMHRFE